MEELVELEDLSYDPSEIIMELVLWASLLLRGEGYVWHVTGSTEYRNETAFRLIPFFGDNSNKSIRDQISRGDVWIDDLLPDVCGGCFTSYGFTVSGRYRIACPSCKGQTRRLAMERKQEMHRLCWNSQVNEAILCQLIHKYYSPNGDRSWELKTYSPV